MGETKRILVRVPNWVGDAVMTLPALGALKGLYPASEITVLARKTVIPVYEGNPAVAGIMEYGEGFRSVRGRFRLAGRLRKRGFDLAVLFQNAFDAAFISFVSRIPERVGYGRDLRSGLLTRAVPFTEEARRLHHIEYYMNIIRALGWRGVPGKRPLPRLYIREAEMERAHDFLQKEGINPDLPLIGAAPGASFGPAKMWHGERFAGALEGLAEEMGAGALIFGGPGDREAAERVFEGIKGRVTTLNLAGRTTLRECMALLKGLSIFITNDSGAMHMAAALGVPTVAVFGSTDPALTGPTGPKTRVIIKKTACSPCFDRVCRFGHMDCMDAVTVEDVQEAALELLGRADDKRQQI